MAVGVLEGMTEALKILGTAVKDTAVETVEKKYGEEAAVFANDCGEVAGNVLTLQG